jgi:hypothetical protein
VSGRETVTTKTCHSEAEPRCLRHFSFPFAARPRNLHRGSFGSRNWWPLKAAGQIPHPAGSPRLAVGIRDGMSMRMGFGLKWQYRCVSVSLYGNSERKGAWLSVPPPTGLARFSHIYPPFPASHKLAFRVGSIISRLRRWVYVANDVALLTRDLLLCSCCLVRTPRRSIVTVCAFGIRRAPSTSLGISPAGSNARKTAQVRLRARQPIEP